MSAEITSIATEMTSGPTPLPSHRAESTPAPLIRISNLEVHYTTGCAVQDVTLDIAPGRITALLGPSGCGKTSVLSSLNRMTDLIPGCRVEGTIRLAGQDILAPDVDVVALRRRVGMIFQKPNPFPISIRRNIELPLHSLGVRARSDLDRIVHDTLSDVGLWNEVKDRLDTPAQGLSGGQQQRLCIARALALEPEVLLLDEPCSALDPIASGIVEDHIDSLRGRITLVIVTHNLAQARRLADDVTVMWACHGAGCLVESGPCEQVFEHPNDPMTAAYVSGSRG
ncbi:MAG: phosphate ABC transporter ATP-binding protein [Candidatus Binatia bacterium]